MQTFGAERTITLQPPVSRRRRPPDWYQDMLVTSSPPAHSTGQPEHTPRQLAGRQPPQGSTTGP